MIFWTVLTDTPLHTILLVEEDGVLIRVKYLDSTPTASRVQEFIGAPEEDIYQQDTPFLNAVEAQLREYFNRDRTRFDLPFRYRGTDFQQQVWDVIASVPFGEHVTYGEIGQRIDRPKAARAIGNACGRNPIPIIVPCHRVLGSGGALGGYSSGLDKKRWLLQLENISFD